MSDVDSSSVDPEDGGGVAGTNESPTLDPLVSVEANVPESHTDAAVEETGNQTHKETREGVDLPVDTADNIEMKESADEKEESSSSSFTAARTSMHSMAVDSPPKGDRVGVTGSSDEAKYKSAAEDTDISEFMQVDESSPSAKKRSEKEEDATDDTASEEKQKDVSSKFEKENKTKDTDTTGSFLMAIDSPPKAPKESEIDEADSPPGFNITSSGSGDLTPYHRRISTSVTMLDVKTCKVVRVFHSMRQAQRELKLDRKHLKTALETPEVDGKPGIADGWRWRVYQPGDDNEEMAAAQRIEKDSSEETAEETTRGGFVDMQTSVTMLDKDTLQIARIFRSMRQASREMGVDRKQLKAALMSQSDGKPGVVGPYRWRLTLPGDEEAIHNHQTKATSTSPKGVTMLDMETCEVIKVFHSIRQVTRETGLSHHALKDAMANANDGKPGVAGPYRWRFAQPDDEESIAKQQKEQETKASGNFSTSPTSVTMLDLETCEVIKVFNSMRQVYRETGIDRKDLKPALVKQSDGKPGIAEGYRWRLARPGDEEAAAKHRAAEVESRKKKRKKTLDLKGATASNIPAGASVSLATPEKLSETLGESAAMEKLTGAANADVAARKKHRRSDGSWSGSDIMRADESDDSSEEDAAGEIADRDHLPSIKQGRLEFNLNVPLQSQLICELCMGYFREPYRITTCLQ
eukprot:scaffold40314_cov206-Amphora_coffeaeformis.AAC.2